eukprot:239312_1
MSNESNFGQSAICAPLLHGLIEDSYSEESDLNLPFKMLDIDNDPIWNVPQIVGTHNSWLICDQHNHIQLIHKNNNLSSIEHHDQNKTNLPLSQIQIEPDANYHILAQIKKYKQLITYTTQKLIINDLTKLCQHDSIKYDLFDPELNNYLHSKTMDFNYNLYDSTMETPTFYYTKHLFLNEENENNAFPFTPSIIPSTRLSADIIDNISNSSIATIFRYDHLLNVTPKNAITPKQMHIEINTSNESINKLHKIITLKYNENTQCMTYQTEFDGNTAFKHCLIDPYKHLNDNGLCIPTIFDATQSNGINVIKSEINQLDYIAYKTLYNEIGNVFKTMQNMFENVINRKLGSNEKVIVEISKYTLQKKGDIYNEQFHRKAMGLNVECVGIYVLESHLDQKNDTFNLCFMMNEFDGIQYKKINNVEEGDCIVFRNEMFHHFGPIEFNSDNNEENECKYRTVLMFYILHSENENVLYSNCNGWKMNLNFNFKYIICYWLRKNNIQYVDFKWMNNLVCMYLFGANYDECVYDRRKNVFNMKTKVMIPSPNKSIERCGSNKQLYSIKLSPKNDDDYDSNCLALNYFDSVCSVNSISATPISH